MFFYPEWALSSSICESPEVGLLRWMLPGKGSDLPKQLLIQLIVVINCSFFWIYNFLLTQFSGLVLIYF